MVISIRSSWFVGVLAILTLPITQYPEITPPVFRYQLINTGADAVTVEATVATPIETQVNGTPGWLYNLLKQYQYRQMQMKRHLSK